MSYDLIFDLYEKLPSLYVFYEFCLQSFKVQITHVTGSSAVSKPTNARQHHD